MRSDWKTDIKVQAEDAIKRSRVWPWEWVGKDTSCCKSKKERISWNTLVQRKLVSMWRLKSPIITKFWHVVVREDKIFWNSSKKAVSEPGGRYKLRIVKRDVPGPVATVQQIASMLDWWGRLICEKDKASEINSLTPPPGRPWRGTCKKLKKGGVRSDRKAEVSLSLSQVSVTARMSSDLLTIKSWSNGPFSRAERTLIEPILKSWSGVVGPGFKATSPARSKREMALKSSSVGLRWIVRTSYYSRWMQQEESWRMATEKSKWE